MIDHAWAFVEALAEVQGTVIDLGSGGGVPGLIIARTRPDLDVVLVDRKISRVDHLRRLVGRLDLAPRVRVVAADADQLALPPAEAVVARSLGPPGSTLASAARCVAQGGLVVISEPPEPRNWTTEQLAPLGLSLVAVDDRRVALFRRST